MPDKSTLDITTEVAAALDAGKPVVALESTIISHGMPYPKNVESPAAVEDAVRDSDPTPATIAILGGHLEVGLLADEIHYLGKKGAQVLKSRRRDLPVVSARKPHG